MGKFYQEKDMLFQNYKLGIPSGFDLPLRDGGVKDFFGYGSYVGAAQTFGRFVTYPFPKLLESCVGVRSLNMGITGSGIKKFLDSKWVIDTINQGKFCVLQVMSGRSTSNSLFHYRTDEWRGTSGIKNTLIGKYELAEDAWDYVFKNKTKKEVINLIEETRKNYVNEYKEFISKINVPIILLWFSVRDLNYEMNFNYGINEVIGSYPHLVNKSMVDKISNKCQAFVEVNDDTGLPQDLFHISTLEKLDRVPGDPRSISTQNEYYPSPEMHMMCAYQLAPVIREIIK